MPDADELGFELLPADDDGSTPEEDIDAAVAGALVDPSEPIAEDDAVVPLGYTWSFDWEAGRFARRGTQPARVAGVAALEQRCLMALHSARYAHAAFSDEFGVEDPQHGIGTVGDEAREAAEDWSEMIRDALLVIDEVADVQCTPAYDPVAGAILIPDLVVTTNAEVELAFPDITIDLETEG